MFASIYFGYFDAMDDYSEITTLTLLSTLAIASATQLEFRFVIAFSFPKFVRSQLNAQGYNH